MSCGAGKLNPTAMSESIEAGKLQWKSLIRSCENIQVSKDPRYIYVPEFKRQASGEFIPCCTRVRCPSGDKDACKVAFLNHRYQSISKAGVLMQKKLAILSMELVNLKKLMSQGCGGSLENMVGRTDIECVFPPGEMEDVFMIMSFIEKSVDSIISRMNCVRNVKESNYTKGCADASALIPYIELNSNIIIQMIRKMTAVLERQITGAAPSRYSEASSTIFGKAALAVINTSKRVTYWLWTHKLVIATVALMGYSALGAAAGIGGAMMLGTMEAGLATELLGTFVFQHFVKSLCKWLIRNGAVMALALLTAIYVLKFVAFIKRHTGRESATMKAFKKLANSTEFDMDSLDALQQEMEEGMKGGTSWFRNVIYSLRDPAKWAESGGFVSFVVIIFVFYKFLGTALSTIICTWGIGIMGSSAIGASEFMAVIGDVTEAGSEGLHRKLNEAIANFKVQSQQSLRELTQKWGSTGGVFSSESTPPFTFNADGTVRWKASLRGSVPEDTMRAAKQWMKDNGSEHQKKIFKSTLEHKEKLDQLKMASKEDAEKFLEQQVENKLNTSKLVSTVGKGFIDAKRFTDDQITKLYGIIAESPFLSAGVLVAIWGLFSYWYRTYNVSRSLRQRGLSLERIDKLVSGWASASTEAQDIDISKFRGYPVIREKLDNLFVKARAPRTSERIVTGLTGLGHSVKRWTVGVKGSKECKCRTSCDSGWCYIDEEAKADCEKKGKRIGRHRLTRRLYMDCDPRDVSDEDMTRTAKYDFSVKGVEGNPPNATPSRSETRELDEEARIREANYRMDKEAREDKIRIARRMAAYASKRFKNKKTTRKNHRRYRRRRK